mmetsp:Transcript_9331/g.28637  ORF Transcript_9331/g.28637 Transcript_9331/m.28637 type:complete len:249 (+) Transcript_9331:3-749(+)
MFVRSILAPPACHGYAVSAGMENDNTLGIPHAGRPRSGLLRLLDVLRKAAEDPAREPAHTEEQVLQGGGHHRLFRLQSLHPAAACGRGAHQHCQCHPGGHAAAGKRLLQSGLRAPSVVSRRLLGHTGHHQRCHVLRSLLRTRKHARHYGRRVQAADQHARLHGLRRSPRGGLLLVGGLDSLLAPRPPSRQIPAVGGLCGGRRRLRVHRDDGRGDQGLGLRAPARPQQGPYEALVLRLLRHSGHLFPGE